MNKGTIHRLGILLSMALVIGSPAFAPKAAPGQKITATTENGVQVIHNPKDPVPQKGGPSRLVLKEELVLGKESAATGPFFADLRSIGVDDQENIWTLDWSDIKVRVFDKTGKLIITFGKKGEGPKELHNPSRMAVSGDGKAYILDLNKLAAYDLKGECLEEFSIARIWPTLRIKLDRAGHIYLDSMKASPEGRYDTIAQYDSQLNPLYTARTRAETFTHGPAVNLFTPIVYFCPTRDGRLIWGYGGEYVFHVLDAKGNAIQTITKDYSPLKLSTGEAQKIIKEMWGDRAPEVKVDIPEDYPPFQNFIGDDEDRLYVKTYEADGKGGSWHDVFDARGHCFTRFSLPDSEMLFIVKKNKMYVLITEDEEGIPLVKRYGMEWK